MVSGKISFLWKDLISSIKSKLKNKAVLRSLERSTRRPINDLYYRIAVYNDQHGAPLFADLRPEVYLSGLYAPADVDILKIFGLKSLNFGKTIAMVKRDLQAGPGHSRIKSPNTDDDWHTRACELLNIAWSRGWPCYSIRSLKQLDIIPLQDGSWVSSDIGDIFYPKYGNVVAPKDLGMRLVDPVATRNESRCAFFDNLGVHRIDVPIVSNIRERILPQLTTPWTIPSLESSVERMRFLFLTQHLHPDEGSLPGKFTWQIYGL
jgi:hypothetical protein